MEWISRSNYARYKEDVKDSKRLSYCIDDRDSMVKRFIELPEKVAREVSTSETVCGRMNLEDLIQEGSLELCIACENIDKELVLSSDNQDVVIASYLRKRIKYAIKNAIRANRGTIKVSASTIKSINDGDESNEDYKSVYFFNVLSTIQDCEVKNNKIVADINGEMFEYNYAFILSYIKAMFNSVLTKDENTVLTKWYGINCSKESFHQIARGMSCTYSAARTLKEDGMMKIKKKIESGEIKSPVFDEKIG